MGSDSTPMHGDWRSTDHQQKDFEEEITISNEREIWPRRVHTCLRERERESTQVDAANEIKGSRWHIWWWFCSMFCSMSHLIVSSKTKADCSAQCSTAVPMFILFLLSFYPRLPADYLRITLKSWKSEIPTEQNQPNSFPHNGSGWTIWDGSSELTHWHPNLQHLFILKDKRILQLASILMMIN